jgi:cellulose synthase/poly-beta-1,6-N-acetylglucosamine synthase-like glycosyltransferase
MISILPTVLVCLSLVGGLVFLLLLIREQFVQLSLSDDQIIDPWPVVSIIVPARNEADSIEEALKSVLALDYPNKEIIVINDRSTDATGEILARLAQEYPELQLITIDRLPSGWLGKNHALQRGAVSASGELLLFTDADIIMQPSLLRRAVSCFLTHRLDHLAIGPSFLTKGVLLNSVISVFLVVFTLYTRPWEVRRARCKGHIGIGAFNLVRASAYRDSGEHYSIALRPDDDMRLGRQLKEQGYRQEVIFGDKAISVEWYGSLREMIIGLEKNSFAGIDYQMTKLIASTVALFAFFIWPFVALLATSGMLWWGNLLIVILLGLCFRLTAGVVGMSGFYYLGFPFGIAVIIHIMWRSALRILLRGGMEWRETFYALDELRENGRQEKLKI